MTCAFDIASTLPLSISLADTVELTTRSVRLLPGQVE
jgi:hypothetical protein